MNIIHYLIGFPPYRHGGASKYAIDLLQEQNHIEGVNTFILIPGNTLCLQHKKSKIKRRKDYFDIPVFSIENPVIEPLLYGIKDASYIFNSEHIFDGNDLEKFYDEIKPNILHVHTLMGLPKIFISYMKSKGVIIVMTSHDYYGFCPKVNLINNNSELCTCLDGSLCAECNMNSRSLFFLKICNSDLFLKYKHLLPIRAANMSKTGNVMKGPHAEISDEKINAYKKLLSHYKQIFHLFDAIHFNSSVTKSVYEKFINIPRNSKIIPITTNYIKERRIKRFFDKQVLKFGFIGGLSAYKGFPLLKSVLSELSNEGFGNFNLYVWEDGLYGEDQDCNKIIYKGKYGKNELDNVFGKMDLLIVPSIWKETFSLVTMEALSYGTPVLVSNNVGAKDIIENLYPSFVFSSKRELYETLKKVLISPTILEQYNTKIIECKFLNLSENKHTLQILNWYKIVRK